MKGVGNAEKVALFCQGGGNHRPVHGAVGVGGQKRIVIQPVAQFIQGLHQLVIAFGLAAVVVLQVGRQGRKALPGQKQSQNVQFAPPVLRGKLHPGNGLHRCALSRGQKFRQPRGGIVIRQCNGP